MRHALILLAAVVFGAGCAPVIVADEPVPTGEYPHHSAAQVVEAVHAAAFGAQVDSYTSTGRITLESPAQNASGTLVLRQRQADTLWASVRGPLNLEIVRALATADSFFVHDRLQNVLLTGSVEAAGQLFPGPAGIDELFEALTGLVSPDPGVRWFINASTLQGVPIYWLTAPDGRMRIAVDPVHWRMRRFERLARDGTVIDRRLYSDFQMFEGRMLPTRVELSNPAEATVVTMLERGRERYDIFCAVCHGQAGFGDGMASLVDGVTERWFTAGYRATPRPEIDQVRAMILATSPQGYGACCAAIRDMDQSEAIRSIRTPTLIVAGADDPATTVEVMRGLHERIPGSRFVEIPQAAHLLNIEQAERFNRTLTSFLAAQSRD
jgi:pimeloyl-ACP methyl ester carboxylesterase